MTKILQNSDRLESLPECERIVQFNETPAELIGGFNTLLVGKRDQMYVANIQRETLVLKEGEMPLAEADVSVLTPMSLDSLLDWFAEAWRTAQERTDSVDITALDTFARIVAAALRCRTA